MASPGALIASPARAALAAVAALLGTIPALLGTHEDRSLAAGLPVIAFSLAFLLDRIDARKPIAADFVAVALLVCPGLATHGWLCLRSMDAMAWYRPEQAIYGILDQSGGARAGAGLLIGGALSLAVLRGRRTSPLIAAMGAAGLWMGAGGLSADLLAHAVNESAPKVLWLALAVTAEWGAGAIFGGLVGLASVRFTVGTRQTRWRAARLGAITGALLCVLSTVPVQLLATQLEISSPSIPLPEAMPGTRIAAITLEPRPDQIEADLQQAFAQMERARTDKAWEPRTYPLAPWEQGLRLSAVVALPPTATRTVLDEVARMAYAHDTNLIGLSARAHDLPPGVVDELMGWPTIELRLDPPPEGTPWLELSADGTIHGLDALQTTLEMPVCGLRAAEQTTVAQVASAVQELTRAWASKPTCTAVAWPPPRCHSGGAGDPYCPTPTVP